MSFSLCLNHTPWVPERVKALLEMAPELKASPDGTRTLLHDTDYRGEPWQESGKLKWMRAQWDWSVAQEVDHHVFMTDDLHLVPGFWKVLGAMVQAQPNVPMGLLANHPRARAVLDTGDHWYLTNSWLTGPAYVLPHELLVNFMAWWEKMPDHPHTDVGTKSHENDDSNLNLYVSHANLCAWHPLPGIVEHRVDLASTVGHGDRYSRERISWRYTREAFDIDGRVVWESTPRSTDSTLLDRLRNPGYWYDGGPLLPVGE